MSSKFLSTYYDDDARHWSLTVEMEALPEIEFAEIVVAGMDDKLSDKSWVDTWASCAMQERVGYRGIRQSVCC